MVKDFFGNIGKFAEGVVDYSKLKIDIADLKRKVDAEYLALGKKVCKVGLTGDILNDEEINKSIEDIADLKAKIEEFDAKLAQMKDKVKCDECGFYNDEKANFCQKCGAKLEKKTVDAIVEEPVEAQKTSEDEVVVDTAKEATPENED